MYGLDRMAEAMSCGMTEAAQLEGRKQDASFNVFRD